jgi:hypothetical protein
MSHPLEEKIVALRRRVRRVAAVYGASMLLAAVVGAIAALGLVDYLLRLQDRGLRIIASLVLLGVTGWMSYRCLYGPLRARLPSIDLARRVQQRFPSLGDRLVSAVEFLHQPEDDPAAGSIALRRAVITQTAAEIRPLDFSDVLDLRPTVRAVVILAAACLLAGLLAAIDPSAVPIAVARLANPLGNAAWPRTTHLAFRQSVEQVARGQAFQVEVVDLHGVPLPAENRIHYRFPGPDESTLEESERMRLVDGAAIARRENVLRPFSYRIEGGDDQSMPWFDVAVVEPPAVETLSIRLIPPAYTGWPTVPGQRHIRALVGTTVQLAGKAIRPLRSAVLCLEGGKKIPAQLGDDGITFTVDFAAEKSGSYWFELTDRQGLRGGGDDRWEIRAVADAPPSVNIDEPTANLFVTPAAVAPLRVSAKDDLAIHTMAIVFRRAESEPERSLSIFEGPEHVAPQLAGNLASDGFSEGDRRVVDYRWDLGPLELKPGSQLSFYATAGDYRPQTGKSEPRRLIVVTPEELQDRVAEREKLILAELERALKMQRGCRSQVESLEVRLTDSPQWEQIDVDNLQAAQNSQRDVGRLLGDRSEGVPMHVLALLADLKNNRLDGADLERRMSTLLAELDRLQREHLPEIERGVTTAVKTAQAALEGQGRAGRPEKTAAAALRAVGKQQDAVIAAIEQLLGQLAHGDSYRRFQREIGQLFRDQEDVTRRTSELGRRTLTRELRDLSPQEAADLKGVAVRQLELARLLDRLLQEMDQGIDELRGHDPSAAKTVADAVDEARRSALSGQMLAAGGRIQQNQIGQAAAGQKQIIESLQEVLDILANRRQQEVARLDDTVKRLRRQQEDIVDETKRFDGLERSQGDLTRSQALALRDVAQSQHKLQAAAVGLAQRLGGAFALALADTAGDMRQAGELLDGRQIGTATQDVEQSAMRRLDRLLEALKPDEPIAQGEGPSGGQGGPQGAAGGGGLTLADLRLLRLLQKEINARTQKLQQAAHPSAKPSDEQVRRYDQLSEEQGHLADNVRQSSPSQQEEQNPLVDIGRQMGEVQQRIKQIDSGSATQTLQGRIVADLDGLIQQARKTAGSSPPSAAQSPPMAARTPDGSAPSPADSAEQQQAGKKPAATSSTRSSGEAKAGKPNVDETRAAMKRLWGELPEHVRQQMQQLPAEDFPPKYETQIEEYFRRLTEEKPTNERSIAH